MNGKRGRFEFKVTIENHDIGSHGLVEGYPLGLQVENHEAVRNLAEIAGFDIVCHKKSSNREYVGLEVKEPFDSQRVLKLFEILEQRYGFKPWPNAVFDMRQRDKYFGVQRIREFTKMELDSAEYLSFFCSTAVGHAVFRTDEQFAQNSYIVDEVKKGKNPLALGCLQPFNALAVSPEMREELKAEKLIGLDADEEVIGSNGMLYKLGSRIFLPRTLTRVVNGQGEDVDPDVWKVTTIHGGTEDHLYDDGYRPCILRYTREEFDKLTPFDIAMRYEPIGNHKQGAYRGLIVSQKFRQVLKKLKVRGTHYFPIQIE